MMSIEKIISHWYLSSGTEEVRSDSSPGFIHNIIWLHQVRIQHVNVLTHSFRIVLQIDVTSKNSGPREDS